MQELISDLQTSLEIFRSIDKIMLLLTAMLGFFLIKTNQRVRVIVLYVLFGCFIVLNPFLFKQEMDIFGENSLYRLGMILLIPVLSAFALTAVLIKISELKKKRIAILGIIILIAASGRFVYTKEYFFSVNNEEKIYDLAVEIADCVTATNKSPTVAISEVQGIFIRQYNANIKLVCAPEKTENWKEVEDENIWSMRTMLSEPSPDISALINLAQQLGCDYLVLMNQQIQEDNPQDYGFKYVNTFEEFQVFENSTGAK